MDFSAENLQKLLQNSQIIKLLPAEEVNFYRDFFATKATEDQQKSAFATLLEAESKMQKLEQEHNKTVMEALKSYKKSMEKVQAEVKKEIRQIAEVKAHKQDEAEMDNLINELDKA